MPATTTPTRPAPRPSRAHEPLFYPTHCPHCGEPLRPDHAGVKPVSAQLLRLARAVAEIPQAASELATALGLSRHTVTAGLRRAERAGLVAHTVTSTPHRGGRRYVYAATELLKAYPSVRTNANEKKGARSSHAQ